MIKLISLKVTNFLSYKELELKFRKGLVLIEGYNYDENTANGSGKSAVIDVICFALYGDLPRNVKFEEIIRWGESNCDIRLNFEKGKETYYLHRSRNPNILDFYVNGDLKNGKDSRETQQIITDVLGVSLNTFLSSIYYSQNSTIVPQFLFASDEEKKEVLTELLNLSVFDRCLEKSKKDEKLLANKVQELKSEVLNFDKNVCSLESEIQDLNRMQEEFESKRAAEISGIEEKIDKIQHDKNSARLTYLKEAEALTSVEASERAKEGYEALIVKGVEEEFEAIKKRDIEICQDLKFIQRQIKDYSELAFKKVCPTCKQSITEELTDSNIKPLVEREQALKVEDKAVKEKYENLKKLVEENVKYKRKISDLEVSIRVTKSVAEKNKQNFEQLVASLDRHYDDYCKLLTNKRNEVNNYSGMINSKNDKLKELKTILEGKKSSLIKGAKYLTVYQVLIKAFSREGIKAFVFAKVINELNYHISSYMKNLFDGNIMLRFDIQSSGANGQIKQKMDTILTINGVRRNIGLLSGGERARILLAVNFALSKLISTRNASVPNFLLLDEVFTGIDDSGLVMIMEFLKKMSENKDFIYIIDHNTNFKNMFDSVYTVEKRNGVSVLKNEEII